MKKKILLTGGSGFIGKNFHEQRREKYTIYSPTHKEVDFSDSESVDYYFRKHGLFDLILHTSAVGVKSSEKGLTGAFKINLRMFFNIVKNAQYFKKMINFGSGSEYDKSSDLIKIKETAFGRKIPSDSYGFYKYVTAKYLENSNLNIYHLRLFGLYGKYEDYNTRLPSNLILKYIRKLPLTINQNTYFDYLYIDDLVKILDYFIEEKPKYKFYNIGSGKKISLLSVAKTINQLSNYSCPIEILKIGLNKEYTCDNTRLIKSIRKFKFTDMKYGLKALYDWYKRNWKLSDLKAKIKYST